MVNGYVNTVLNIPMPMIRKIVSVRDAHQAKFSESTVDVCHVIPDILHHQMENHVCKICQ